MTLGKCQLVRIKAKAEHYERILNVKFEVPGRSRHYRCNLCGLAAAGEIPSNEQEAINYAFIDLENAFDHVPRKVIWWALRKLGVEEWIVQLVQGMSANVPSQDPVGKDYSQEFDVKVRVHQGSVLSVLLFIIVLEAMLCEYHSEVL